MRPIGKIVILLIIAAVVASFFIFDFEQYLTLESLKQKQSELQALYRDRPALVVGVFFLIYVATTALSLPSPAILTLIAGALFGLWVATIVVSLAATIGATLAFLASRFLFRDYVQAKFGDRLQAFNRGIAKDGVFYLFALRLNPAFPFFLINLGMGLTNIPLLHYFVVSQIGMIPGTFLYVNAGTQLAKIDSLRGILSPSIVLSFSLLGLFPLITKFAVDYLRSRRHLRRFKKPMRFEYDLVAIGAGAAGLVTSYIGAAVKAKVALIEKHRMGGDCLNTGCVPSKALIRSAKILSYIRRAREFGLKTAAADFEFASVMDRIQEVIKKIEPHDSVARYSDLGVECLQGEGRIVSPYEVQVDNRRLITRNIVIATGATPIVPQLPGLEKMPYYTSENIWNLRKKPRKLVVLGGGPIGCELAQAFRRLDIDTTLIERGPALLPREEPEARELISGRLREEGVLVLTRHEAVRIENEALICQHNGSETRLECDALLFALGRRANTRGFGLDELGIKTSAQGTIETDEHLRTIFPNVLACGDVAGPFQFTHTASHQAWYASVNALFRPFRQFKADYRVIPWCTYTDPEVARVGLSESEARARKIPYMISTCHLDDLDRAICDSETHGFVKVLTRPGSDKILGVTIAGTHAGDLIAEFVLAMKYGIGLNKILGTIHIYPTLAEANKYAAGVWKRQTAPAGVLKWLERFHRIRRRFRWLS